MSATDQLQTTLATLTAYSDALDDFLIDGGVAVPSFEDYFPLLGYDEILTDAKLGENRAASYSTGAQVDTVHLVLAITREFGMRTSVKADYYDEAQVETETRVSYYDTLYGRYYNYFRGSSPDQRNN